jgi:hypothetical protein
MIGARDATIHELTAEVEQLRGALPRAEILRELSTASIEDLEGIGRALRLAAEGRLLTPAPHLADRHAAFLTQEGSGLARILPRGRFDKLTNQRGGGAYWSFATRDNSYDKEPDLELQLGMFSSGFYGNNDGRFLDLGDASLDDIEAAPDRPPRVLGDAEREAWPLLFQERPSGVSAGSFAASLRGTEARVMAMSGHTYVLRSILEEEHDLLVVFRVLDGDAHGQTLLWRILRSWEPWEGRRRR